MCSWDNPNHQQFSKLEICPQKICFFFHGIDSAMTFLPLPSHNGTPPPSFTVMLAPEEDMKKVDLQTRQKSTRRFQWLMRIKTFRQITCLPALNCLNCNRKIVVFLKHLKKERIVFQSNMFHGQTVCLHDVEACSRKRYNIKTEITPLDDFVPPT